MTIKELVKTINQEVESLSIKNEPTIRHQIIVPIFLQQLGYDLKRCTYEENLKFEKTDIFVENKLIVETKPSDGLKGSIEQIKCELIQLSRYLNNHNIEWGILSNGCRYILINNKIDGAISDKIVFDISTKKRAMQEYLKYFSYENIFVTQKTQYFADIAQFKAYKKDNSHRSDSWVVYQNTLFNFFDYYCQNHNYTHLSADKHEPLLQIQMKDFFDFINYKTKNSVNGRRINSKETVKNKYSYIFSFLSTLEKHNYIRRHNFSDRNTALLNYEVTPKIKDRNYLSSYRFDSILKYLYNSKNNYRNIAIFLLCAYYGFERSDVHDLCWDNIDFNNNTITINERNYKMIDLLIMCFQELKKLRKNNKNKQNNVFVTFHNGKYFNINESTINDIFNSLVRIDPKDKVWKSFSPQYVKSCLIKNMFQNGYSLEQIIAETGIEISHILSYIPMDTIKSVGKERLKKGLKRPINPFKENVDSFYKAITA